MPNMSHFFILLGMKEKYNLLYKIQGFVSQNTFFLISKITVFLLSKNNVLLALQHMVLLIL